MNSVLAKLSAELHLPIENNNNNKRKSNVKEFGREYLGASLWVRHLEKLLRGLAKLGDLNLNSGALYRVRDGVNVHSSFVGQVVKHCMRGRMRRKSRNRERKSAHGYQPSRPPPHAA